MRLEATPCRQTGFLTTLLFGWASHSRRLYRCSQHSRSAAFRCRDFITTGNISTLTHFTDNIVRVGLNYQFH